MALPTRTRLIAVVTAMVAVLTLVGVGVVRAGDAASPPPIEADRLLASTAIALSHPVTIAGDVETHLDLGLPEVPTGLGGEGGAIAMIGGTQRFRVWHSADGLRIAHVTQVSERDLVVNHEEAWWWNASEMKATQVRFEDLRALMSRVPGGLPMGSTGHTERARSLAEGAAALGSDPITAARRGIEFLAPYASLSVQGAGEIAGRAVYDLVLTPLSDRTLIGSVELSIDAETFLPLRFQVIARGSGNADLSAGFTSVSYAAIDPAVFSFTPPPGADVVDGLDGIGQGVEVGPRMPTGLRREGAKPHVFGSGFESRVAIPLTRGLPRELTLLLPYAGPLFSAVEVGSGDDRRLLIGAVPLDDLQADAATFP
jgi:outer membrane lipoprotein-sorting protein